MQNNELTDKEKKNIQWEEYKNKITKDTDIDKIKYYVLNEKNRLITKEFLRGMFETLGIKYCVNDIKLFEISMTHNSYIDKDFADLNNFKNIFSYINVLNGETLIPISNSNMAIPLQKTSYERLECLGDAILRFIITDYLFNRYSEAGPGIISNIRAQLENRTAFAFVAKKIGLCKYILLSRGQEFLNAREKNEKLQCDVFEAFICALFLDINKISYDDIGNNFNVMKIDRGHAYQFCYSLIKKMIEDYIILPDLLYINTNYKQTLSAIYQKLNWNAPIYSLKDVINDSNNLIKKKYQFYVKDGNNKIMATSPYVTNKTMGEQMCAKLTIEKLKVIYGYEKLGLSDNFDNNFVYEELLDTKEKMEIINFN